MKHTPGPMYKISDLFNDEYDDNGLQMMTKINQTGVLPRKDSRRMKLITKNDYKDAAAVNRLVLYTKASHIALRLLDVLDDFYKDSDADFFNEMKAIRDKVLDLIGTERSSKA